MYIESRYLSYLSVRRRRFWERPRAIRTPARRGLAGQPHNQTQPPSASNSICSQSKKSTSLKMSALDSEDESSAAMLPRRRRCKCSQITGGESASSTNHPHQEGEWRCNFLTASSISPLSYQGCTDEWTEYCRNMCLSNQGFARCLSLSETNCRR